MTRGVVFFMNMESQLPFLYVAMHSLLQTYDGPVGFTYRNVGQKYLDELRKKGVECVEYSKPMRTRARRRENWLGKAFAHKEHPFDVNLCFDLDCQFFNPITKDMFDIVQEHELSVRGYDTPPGHESRKRWHLSRAIGQEVGPLLAVNSGFTGSVKSSPKVDEWHEYVRLIDSTGTPLKKNPEEWGLAAMRAFDKVHIADVSWCNAFIPEEIPEGTIAYHYMGGSAWKSERWLAASRKVCDENFMGAADFKIFPEKQNRQEEGPSTTPGAHTGQRSQKTFGDAAVNTSLILDQSVMEADHYKAKQFLKEQNIMKFLQSIEGDEDFEIHDGLVVYTGGKKLKMKVKPRPQQVKAFHPLGQPDVLLNFDRASVNLTDIYRGCTGFLILSGPSVRELDLSLLEKPGLLKMCVNNSSRITRPHLWTCVDPPDRFLYSVWADPTVMKFVPDSFRKKSLWDTYDDKPILDRTVGDCPNVYYYPRNTNFVPGAFLSDTSINWGQSKGFNFFDPEVGKKVSGTRSCMLVAIRVMAMLGVRTIFLVGADFNMSSKKPYAFDQKKHEGGAKSNNNAYKALNSFFNVLQPYFKAINLNIYNTNPDSGLKTFDHIPYKEAINIALEDVRDPSNEKTAGMYEKLKEKKKRARKAGRKTDPGVLQGVWDPNTRTLGDGSAASEQPAPTKEQVEIAGKLHYTHDDVLKMRQEFTTVYPHLVTTMATLMQGKDSGLLELGEGCGGCGGNRKPRTRRGKRARAQGLKARAKIAEGFTRALFEAINADPSIMKGHTLYRPDILIEGERKPIRMSQIVDGTGFEG